MHTALRMSLGLLVASCCTKMQAYEVLVMPKTLLLVIVSCAS